MTRPEATTLDHIRGIVTQTRKAQGLPPTVKDPLVVGAVVGMLRATESGGDQREARRVAEAA